MKRIVSILLVLSMIFISTGTVFATELEADSPSYALEDFFKDYHEYSLSEMIRFIGANPAAYGYVEYLSYNYMGLDDYNYDYDLWTTIHVSGDFSQTSARSKVFSQFAAKINTEKYMTEDNTETYRYLDYCVINTSRPSSPSSYMKNFSILVGDKGNICFLIEIKNEFIKHLKSLDRIERNRKILNFLMNLMDDEFVGVSFSFLDDPMIYNDYASYASTDTPSTFVNTNSSSFTYINPDTCEPIVNGDCNADGSVNGIDSYLMRGTLSGNDDSCIDPLAVDISRDGELNAKDSLALKRKITIG
ncbi:MAG: dockerin type I repeat-containing protein [Clostridia bacterium]|nr:dockerin type I repeat-containing protein [Clostridia bacterium]